jgi:uncharacterized protein (DUF362 family)
MKTAHLTRRCFLGRAAALAAGVPVAATLRDLAGWAAEAPAGSAAAASPRVAIVPCRTYGAAVRPALDRAFDSLGGLGPLVKGKTVTVKVNLTGTNFAPYLGRPVGETFMTHGDTAAALAAACFAAGARRLRFVESTQSRADLATSLRYADWDVRALGSLGKVEFENTRNLGQSKRYAHFKVPGGGRLFSALDLNQAYEDTDVLVSLAKLKNHVTAGVTLSLKNLFGVTPNSLYGADAGREDATEGRSGLHNPDDQRKAKPPGLKEGVASKDPTWRIPRIIVDICAARPVHLAVIDGITAMSGGEGPWCENAPIKVTTPGVIIAGFDPVAADAVATAVMGYENPRATRGQKPFQVCDNHLVLAEEAGLGTADLARIEVRGLSIAQARYPYG